MGFTSTALNQLAARAAALRAQVWGAVLTFGGSDYACAIDPGDIGREPLDRGGFKRDHSIDVIVATATGISISDAHLGREITIKTTATAKLQTFKFHLERIRLHPDNPEIVLTLKYVGLADDTGEGVYAGSESHYAGSEETYAGSN